MVYLRALSTGLLVKKMRCSNNAKVMSNHRPNDNSDVGNLVAGTCRAKNHKAKKQLIDWGVVC